MVSFGSSLIETCRTSGTLRWLCAYPDKTRWCGVTTTLPPSLLPAYSTYASNASSWWSAHSSKVVRVAQECPILWYEASNYAFAGSYAMNQTLINAECYAEANPSNPSNPVSTTSTSAAPGPGITSSLPTITSTSTTTSSSSSVPGEPCNGGTNGDEEEGGGFIGLCSFACSFGYCPPGPCKCTSYGAPGTPPPTNGRDGCPLPGASDAYKGLYSYAYNHGYCPDTAYQYC